MDCKTGRAAVLQTRPAGSYDLGGNRFLSIWHDFLN